MNHPSKTNSIQKASAAAEAKMNILQSSMEHKDSRKLRYVRTKVDQPDATSNQTVSMSSTNKTGSAETSGERTELDQTKSILNMSGITNTITESVNGYAVPSLKESASEPLDSKTMHMMEDKMVQRQNLRRSTRSDAIKQEFVSLGQSPDSGSDGKSILLNQRKQFKNGPPVIKAGTKRRRHDRIDSDGFMPPCPTSQKYKPAKQAVAMTGTSAKDGSSSCVTSPGLRKHTMSNGLQQGNKEALPARTFDETKEAEIIALIEQHQRDQLRRDPMRELEEALMDRTTASLNRRQKLTTQAIRQPEEVITPTFIQIDLLKEPPLKVISQASAERFQELAQQKMDQMVQKASDETWSSFDEEAQSTRKDKVKKQFKLELQSPKKRRRLNQETKASEQGYDVEYLSQNFGSGPRKSERVRRKDQIDVNPYQQLGYIQSNRPFARANQGSGGMDIKSNANAAKSRSGYNPAPHAFHYDAMTGSYMPHFEHSVAQEHDQTAPSGGLHGSYQDHGRMLVEKYAAKRHQSPSLYHKMQVAGYFDEQLSEPTSEQLSPDQLCHSQSDFVRKREAKMLDKELQQAEQHLAVNEWQDDGLNHDENATSNQIEFFHQAQNYGERASAQHAYRDSVFQNTSHKVQRSQSKPVNSSQHGLDASDEPCLVPADEREGNRRFRGQIRMQASHLHNAQHAIQKFTTFQSQEQFDGNNLRSSVGKGGERWDMKLSGQGRQAKWAGDTPQLLQSGCSSAQQQRNQAQPVCSTQEVSYFAHEQGSQHMEQLGSVYLRILPPPEDSDSTCSSAGSRKRSKNRFGKTLRQMIALTNMLTVYQMDAYQSMNSEVASEHKSRSRDSQTSFNRPPKKETLNETLRRLLGPQDEYGSMVVERQKEPSRDDQGFARPENVIRGDKNQFAGMRISKKL